PGRDRTRSQALAQTAREAMLVALGLIAVLLVSGVIEAFVTPAPIPGALRVGIGVLALGGFLAYVLLLGRIAAREGTHADLSEFERGATAPSA
ncbi:MAG: stage II sporulation protein M, partial [Dactylosporangium sp.]|nr:stage II sporulation protein M [Dactylosporangium sp.]NNJ60137.1 stage II sporulation protein M [Dactylosporangium sp.]